MTESTWETARPPVVDVQAIPRDAGEKVVRDLVLDLVWTRRERDSFRAALRREIMLRDAREMAE